MPSDDPMFRTPIVPHPVPPPSEEPLPEDNREALLALHRMISRDTRLNYRIYTAVAGDPLNPAAPKGAIPRLADLEASLTSLIARFDEHIANGCQPAPSARKKKPWNRVWLAAAAAAATVLGGAFGAKISAALGWHERPPSSIP